MPMIKILLVCSRLDAYFTTTHNLMTLGNFFVIVVEVVIEE